MSKPGQNGKGDSNLPERNRLFGAKSLQQFPLAASRTSLAPADSVIGDNLHDLSDKQIDKLVQLKFHGDPIQLIRQVSSDLSAKETELILLRKEKFQREQELYRLCTEYGNLSLMEIDKRLNALRIEDNVHKVVSEMIDTAMKDEPAKEEPRRLRRRVRSGNRSPLPEKTPAKEARESQKSPDLAAEKLERRASNWYSFFNSSEERLASKSSTSLNTRLRSLSLNNFKQNTSHGRVPVELESVGFESDEFMASPDPNIDRHGFYNDTTISKPTPRTPDLVRSTESTVAEATISTFEISRSIDTLKHLGELHDAKNEEHVKKWDQFMWSLKKDEMRHHRVDSNHAMFGAKAVNLKRHDPGLAKFFVSLEDEKNDDSRQFKSIHKLIHEGGIPPKYRNELWFELSGAKNKEIPGEYLRLVDSARTSTDERISKQVEQINLDLHRTLPSNRYFNDMATSQPGPHFYKLQNILYAFVAHKPEVGYSQGMNKIVGNLLLGVSEGNNSSTHRLSEEDVFWLFVSITEECLPKYGELDYFSSQSLPFIQRDVAIVQQCYFPKYVRELHEHFVKLGVEVQVVLLGWWLGVFTDSFTSVELWFKLLDSLLISEHSEVKFVSYSLAFFKLFERTLLDLHDADDIYRLMNNLKLTQVKQTNIRFNDLIQINNEFERSMNMAELEQFRRGISA